MKTENIVFKNEYHELNYRILMNLIKEYLRSYKEIQAAVYLIALVETYSVGASKYIFCFVEKSLEQGFFDNPDTNRVAISLANRLWNTAYLAFEDDFVIYFYEVVALNLFEILDRDKTDFIDYVQNLINESQ